MTRPSGPKPPATASPSAGHAAWPTGWSCALVLLVVVLVILALSADTIVTSIAESRLRKQTGLEVRLVTA